MNTWKNILRNILEKGFNDSDVEDFIGDHPEISPRLVWYFVDDFNSPSCCKGCANNWDRINNSECKNCSRIHILSDNYRKRDE